jgi:hypothetical protein
VENSASDPHNLTLPSAAGFLQLYHRFSAVITLEKTDVKDWRKSTLYCDEKYDTAT